MVVTPNDVFNITPIPEKYIRKAEIELMETPENKEVAFRQLRELIQAEKDMNLNTSDEYLIRFLRARKFNVAKSFNLLKKYTTFRKNSQYFSGYDEEKFVKILKDKIVTILPERCPDGCLVIFFRLNNWNPQEISLMSLIQFAALIAHWTISNPLTQINGYKVITDLKSDNMLNHLRMLKISLVMPLYHIAQDTLPGRFKGFHHRNFSAFGKWAYALFYPLIPEKIRKRIIFHKSNDSLKEYFPASLLPPCLGGHAKDLDNSNLMKSMLAEAHKNFGYADD